MSPKSFYYTGLGLLLLSVAGCCGKPQPVAFEDAMKSLGTGIKNMHESLVLKDGKRLATGLYPTEANVSFNVSSIKKKDGSVQLAVSPLPISSTFAEGDGQSSATGKLGFSNDNTASNTITLKFRTVLVGKTTKTKTTESGTGDSKKIVTSVTVVEGPTDPAIIIAFYNALKTLKNTHYLETMMKANKDKDPKYQKN